MEKPYIETRRVVIDREYNPKYGDSKICVCGHTYERHFDGYEDMSDVGCKYCQCHTFKLKLNVVNYIVTGNGRTKIECETKEDVWEAMGNFWRYEVESPTGKSTDEFIPF